MTDRNGHALRLMPRDIKSVAAALWMGCVALCYAGQAYYSPISINSAQVPSTQTDFPVLVSQTDNRFKTIGNGGHVANSNGYDIRPYSDSGLTTAITGYELERYNASTGEVVMWVKVGSLSSSTTPIYLGYGDSSLTTDGSSATTWSNSFFGVNHVKDGTTLSIANSAQSCGGANTGTTAATGTIDGGAGFVAASTQHFTVTACSGSGSAVTVSFWMKGTSFPNAYNTPISIPTGGANTVEIMVKSSGKLAMYFHTSAGYKSYDGTGSTTLSTATWYYIVGSYSNAAGLIGYVNASSDGTAAGGSNSDSFTDYEIGHSSVTSSRDWDGTLDELRVATVARSANWITTEYNNQSAPATFETLGTEVPVSSPTSSNFFYLFP